MKYTLKDAIILGGERDITDEIFDYLNYFDCSIDKNKDDLDAYDKVMLWLGESIEAIRGDKDVIVCKISQFIDDNRTIFDKFLNQVYKEQYQPRNMERIESESEEFYDYYMVMFSDLINGNFAESDYEKLLKIINQ